MSYEVRKAIYGLWGIEKSFLAVRVEAHAANSGFSNVSRFGSGTTARQVSGYIDSALRYGTVIARNGGYMIEHAFRQVIGTGQSGAAASSIRVFVQDGHQDHVPF